MSHTTSQIHQLFSPLLFYQVGSSRQRRKLMKKYDIQVSCDRYELLNIAWGKPPELPLSTSWVMGFLLYIHSTFHLCFQQISNKLN